MMKLFKSQSLNTSVYMCICDSRTKILHFFIDNSEIFFFSSRHDDLIQIKKNRNYFSFDWTHTHTIGEKVSESWNFFFFFFGCLQYDFGCWFLCYWIIIIMVFIRFYRFDWLSLFCVRLRMIHPSLPLSTNCVCVLFLIFKCFCDGFFFRFVCFWPFRNRILFFHKHFQLISIHSPSLGLSLSLIRIHSFIVDSQHYH